MKFVLCFFCLILPSAGGSQLAPQIPQVESFLSTMQSERISLPQREGLSNHYYKTQNQHPTALVFLPGMGEAAIKYYELAKDLQELPVTLYMWNHIGQGLSSHLLPQEPQKIYIDSFETHLAALENFLKLLKTRHQTVHVIGHSMGGHLALRTAFKNPKLINALALTSPMIDINKKTLPVQYVTWLINTLPGTWYPPLYFLFKKGEKEKNNVTKSQERMAVLEHIFLTYPEQKRDGATMGWIREALRSIEHLKAQDPKTLTLPILLLQAETDFLVSNEAQNNLCSKALHCQSQVVPDSYHELLFEKDPARATTLNYLLDFLKKN